MSLPLLVVFKLATNNTIFTRNRANPTHITTTMALKASDVLAKAAELETRLQGKRYFGGDTPSADDVREFEALLGTGSLGLFRWVKHMASFSAAERAAWGAPVRPAKAPAKAPAEGKGKAAAPKPAAKEPAAKGAAAAPKPGAKAAAPAAPAAGAGAGAQGDDDFDPFAEDNEADIAAREQAIADRAAAHAASKPKKTVIAKSSILMDIKGWDDTTDLEAVAQKLKAIEKDGLVWGAHKLVPVAYGMNKLQLLMVIEDDKVSSDDIEEMIMQFDEEVQSMDVVAWNKI